MAWIHRRRLYTAVLTLRMHGVQITTNQGIVFRCRKKKARKEEKKNEANSRGESREEEKKKRSCQ